MKRDHHQILREDYPDIYKLWVDAVNADFECEFLCHHGRDEEADTVHKLHEELWEEYRFASKLVLTGHEDLE